MATKQSDERGTTQRKGTADKAGSKTTEKSQKQQSDSKSKTPGRH